MDKHRLSLIIIGVLAVAILFGGWAIGIQPQLDRIDQANTQTESIRQLNDAQQAKNSELAADMANMDGYRDDLSTLQQAIPAARSQQELINQIDDAATSADVDVRTLSFDAAAAYTPPTGLTITAPPNSSLVAVPLTMTANGTRTQLEAFVTNLQKSKRIVTIASTQFNGQEDDTLQLAGTTWVLLPS